MTPTRPRITLCSVAAVVALLGVLMLWAGPVQGMARAMTDTVQYTQRAYEFAGDDEATASAKAIRFVCDDKVDYLHVARDACERDAGGVLGFPKQYQAIFLARPGLPMLMSVFIRAFGDQGIYLTVLLLQVATGVLLALAARALGLPGWWPLAAEAAYFLLPSGYVGTRVLSEAASAPGLAALLYAVALMVRDRRRNVAVTVAVVAFAWLFAVRAADATMAAAFLLLVGGGGWVAGLRQSRERQRQRQRSVSRPEQRADSQPESPPRSRPAPSPDPRPDPRPDSQTEPHPNPQPRAPWAIHLTAVSGSCLIAMIALNAALSWPTVDQGIADIMTDHFTQPVTSDMYFRFLHTELRFWRAFLPLIAGGAYLVVLAALGLWGMARRLPARAAAPFLAVAAVGPASLALHPGDWPRMLAPMWIVVALGLPLLLSPEASPRARRTPAWRPSTRSAPAETRSTRPRAGTSQRLPPA